MLGPSRDIAVLTFPLETAFTAVYYQPLFEIEARAAISDAFALTARGMAVWYVQGGIADDGHGWGAGGTLGFQYYLVRRLSGPFVGLHGGDIESFVDGERGRTFGGAVLFGYVLNDDWATLSLGLGIGYWHRTGVVDVGTSLPEILSLNVGVGWAGRVFDR